MRADIKAVLLVALLALLCCGGGGLHCRVHVDSGGQ